MKTTKFLILFSLLIFLFSFFIGCSSPTSSDDEITDPCEAGHTPGAAATCTTAQTCTVCGEVIVAALGHTPGAAATCTTAQTCTVCGEVIVAALGHDWADTVNNRLCLTCGELNFTPARTIDLADDTGDIDFTETGTVLIKGVSNGQRRIHINDVTDVYIENGTVITGPDAVSSIQISVSSASTIYGGGSDITITGGSGTSEGIYGAVDILTIAGKMGSISGGIGGIRSNTDLIITGSTGNISGGNFGLYATNSVTISGSIGNDTASSLTGGFMGQIYINSSSYNDFPLSTPKPWVWHD